MAHFVFREIAMMSKGDSTESSNPFAEIEEEDESDENEDEEGNGSHSDGDDDKSSYNELD